MPRQFRGRIVTLKAAAARAFDLLDAVTLPPGTTSVPPPAGSQSFYDDRNQDFLTRSRWVHTKASASEFLGYLARHVPAGMTVAHLVPSGPNAQLVEQLTDAWPSPVALVISLNGGVFELDASAQWSASRSAAEHIPASVHSALLTFEPEPPVAGVASRRVQYSGPGVATLIRWFNSRQATDPYASCTASSVPDKLGVTFHVGARVVTFYWIAGDCSATAVVNGKRAPELDHPPTALVERLLKVKAPA